MIHKAYIALGGNVEDPVAAFCDYLQHIDTHLDMRCVGRSSLYKSAPVGNTNQPDFLNAVICIETLLSPLVLLDDVQAVENCHGRVRLFENSPRILDLDLLLYDNQQIESDRLVVPHPRMLSRAFVVLPLLEMSAELQMPDGQYVKDVIHHIQNQKIKPFHDPRW